MKRVPTILMFALLWAMLLGNWRAEDAQTQFSVVSYRFRIEDGRGTETGSFDVSGAAFDSNPQLRKALEALQSGDRIFIEGIRVRKAGGRIISLADAYVRLR